MIENLNGIRETVNFKANSNIRLYANVECEAYPNHWHAPLEIIMPIKNSYPVSCCNQSILLREGDILVINPGALHSMEAVEGERLIFQADLTVLHSIQELETILSLINPFILITEEEAPQAYQRMKDLMLELSSEYFQDSPLSEAAIYSKLIEIFVLIGRNYTANVTTYNHNLKKQREYTDLILNICKYIHEHCKDNITLDDLARVSGYSKYHFSRLFKQYTTVSVYKYINTKKIEYAEKLLMNDDLTVTEVALRCGFSNLSAFIRMFKIMKNCTPTEFKEMYMY